MVDHLQKMDNKEASKAVDALTSMPSSSDLTDFCIRMDNAEAIKATDAFSLTTCSESEALPSNRIF
ncbi:hypothetical protein P3L10_013404 [Capsicum annuum]